MTKIKQKIPYLLAMLAPITFTFCTGCQYLPETIRELGGLKFKESVEIDLPESAQSSAIPVQSGAINTPEFPEHCNKDVR